MVYGKALTVTLISDNGKTTNPTASENTSGATAMFMRENGRHA